MQIPLVMTVIGPDRTGLVESVARAVADHGGNWLESRMCRLGGEFAGILRVEIPAEKKSGAARRAAKNSRPSRSLFMRTTGGGSSNPCAARRNSKSSARTDRASSTKSPAALARAGVNVEEFSSEVVSAPMSGETLFKADARLQLPERCDLAALKKDLEKIAADLLVDVSLAEFGGK